MSKNSVSRGSSNGTVGSEIKFAGNDKEKMYEPKQRRKLVRVLTVVAYVFSVSLAAIMLSLFYIFIYNPGKGAAGNDKPQGWPDSKGLPAQRDFRLSAEDMLDLANGTYEGPLEKEEPRALPVQAVDSLMQSKPLSPVAKLSPLNENENKTFLNRILKFFKTQ